MAVTVGGANVADYMYKVGTTSATTCSSATGYSSEAAVATHITSNISGVADGSVTLCVVGRNAAGNYQTYANATVYTWTKKTSVTAFTNLAISPTSPGNNTKPTISGNTDDSAVVAFYSLPSCAGTLLGNATANASTGAFSVTPASSIGVDGNYNFSVLSTDTAGNTLCSSTVAYTLDTTSPTAVISTTTASSTNVSPIPVTITFSEAVTGFALSNLTLVNGTASSLSAAPAPPIPLA